ncbi:MAG TPA: polysaccharide pyruvyl transferase family protein [Acidimicrobiales bacterium]|nr:polysaccharide pyruvyl transferase family protein [Acidimicrobiales bacterium]
MVGTFDLENLGDLLFPYVAQHELARRLGSVELELFSYRSLDPPAWPLKVRPVHAMAERLGEFDLLVVGGGHLIRGDVDLAPGYEPTDATTSHPFGLWLVPTLLAAGAGVPVAWNAVGTIESIPATIAPLVDAAIGAVDYLAVRDLVAARFVASRSASVRPVVVPDTIFGITALLDGDVAERARALLAATGVDGRYVVIQPSALLEGHLGAVDDLAAAAASLDVGVLELPCGPCHHDEVGRLALTAPTASIGAWPDPLVCAALLAGAEAVVAASLHAGIIATTAGVPLFRPLAAPGAKHEQLDHLPGVTALPVDGSAASVDASFGRRAPTSEVLVHRASLEHHWDEVARLASAGRGRRGPSTSIAALFESLPAELARRDDVASEARDGLVLAHAAERRRDAAARAGLEIALAARGEQLAEERARAAALDAELQRTPVRGALAAAEALTSLRRRMTPPNRGSSSDR